MSGSFVLTPSASRDIDDIFEYVLEHSGPNQALHIHKKLVDGFKMVGEYPGIGHVREDLADESVRVHAVFSFLVIYRSETKPVQVLRVIHGARDLNSAME
jgi:plasmid stabilization system protein ParE